MRERCYKLNSAPALETIKKGGILKVKSAALALASAALLAAPFAHAGKMDFNNDGRADVFWRNSVTGENYFYPLNGTTILGSEGFVRTVADPNWQVAGDRRLRRQRHR